MESSEGFLPMPPFPFLPDSKPVPDSDPQSSSRFLEGVSHHHRCSSESFLIEEQPSWLDDLLNDSDALFHRGHRRSASDSCAYLGDESEFVNTYFGPSTLSQDLAHHSDIKGNATTQTEHQETDGLSSLAAENGTQELSTQNLEGSEKGAGSQVKNPGSKAESKRSKQHNTHRSRVRKLQYTSHLERTLEVLKAEGNEVTAELEFVEQQNIILTMENRALRQRLETLSQEQLIKNWEQGMLEREIARLQSLFHLQKQQQQQMQMHQQQQLHNQHSKHCRNRSRDLDHQVNNASIKNKDVVSTKDSLDGPVHA